MAHDTSLQNSDQRIMSRENSCEDGRKSPTISWSSSSESNDESTVQSNGNKALSEEDQQAIVPKTTIIYNIKNVNTGRHAKKNSLDTEDTPADQQHEAGTKEPHDAGDTNACITGELERKKKDSRVIKECQIQCTERRQRKSTSSSTASVVTDIGGARLGTDHKDERRIEPTNHVCNCIKEECRNMKCGCRKLGRECSANCHPSSMQCYNMKLTCNCIKSQCSDKRCRCQKWGVECNATCHQGIAGRCLNMPSTSGFPIVNMAQRDTKSRSQKIVGEGSNLRYHRSSRDGKSTSLPGGLQKLAYIERSCWPNLCEVQAFQVTMKGKSDSDKSKDPRPVCGCKKDSCRTRKCTCRKLDSRCCASCHPGSKCSN